MSKAIVQSWAIWLTVALLGVAAGGYFAAPSAMLSVVGIVSTPNSDFLVRTLAAAFVAMIPIALAARKRTGSASERAILTGLAIYMVLGSAVDLHAYLSALVGPSAVPSIGLRTLLGLVLLWLAW